MYFAVATLLLQSSAQDMNTKMLYLIGSLHIIFNLVLSRRLSSFFSLFLSERKSCLSVYAENYSNLNSRALSDLCSSAIDSKRYSSEEWIGNLLNSLNPRLWVRDHAASGLSQDEFPDFENNPNRLVLWKLIHETFPNFFALIKYNLLCLLCLLSRPHHRVCSPSDIFRLQALLKEK